MPTQLSSCATNNQTIVGTFQLHLIQLEMDECKEVADNQCRERRWFDRHVAFPEGRPEEELRQDLWEVTKTLFFEPECGVLSPPLVLVHLPAIGSASRLRREDIRHLGISS